MTGAAPGVVVIAGLGHSGSTFLQYLLAQRPGCVGLGEIEKLFRVETGQASATPAREMTCACGAPVPACPLWATLLPAPDEPASTGQRRLPCGCRPHTRGAGSGSTPRRHRLRSSPGSRWSGRGSCPVRAIHLVRIHLVRDVRGWSMSEANNRLRKDRKAAPLVRLMRTWRQRNQGIERKLAASGVPPGASPTRR